MTIRSMLGSQAIVMVPTRNSSVIGASSGSVSDGDFCAGGTSTPPPLRRSTSSSTRSRCSASTDTCCFSHDDRGDPVPLTGLEEERPLSGLADRAGHEPVRRVVAVNQDGHAQQPNSGVGRTRAPDSSHSTTSPAPRPPPTGASGGRRSAPRPGLLGRRPEQLREVGGGGVHGDHVGPVGGVADDRHRGRVDQDPLESVEVDAEGVGQDRLDHVAVGDRGPDRVRAVLGGEFRVPGPDRADRPGRHLGHRLPARETHRRRLRLDRRPELLLAEVLQRPARPLAVAALDQAALGRPGVRVRRRAATTACAVCRQRRSGELTITRSGTDGQPRSPRSSDLLLAGRVQLDSRRPAGEHPGGVGRRAPVPDQQHRGHDVEVSRGSSASASPRLDQPSAGSGSGRGGRPSILGGSVARRSTCSISARSSRDQPARSVARSAGRPASPGASAEHRAPLRIDPGAQPERPARRRRDAGEGVGEPPVVPAEQTDGDRCRRRRAGRPGPSPRRPGRARRRDRRRPPAVDETVQPARRPARSAVQTLTGRRHPAAEPPQRVALILRRQERDVRSGWSQSSISTPPPTNPSTVVRFARVTRRRGRWRWTGCRP